MSQCWLCLAAVSDLEMGTGSAPTPWDLQVGELISHTELGHQIVEFFGLAKTFKLIKPNH